MKSLLASVRSVGGLDRVDHAVQWLEDEWRKHGEVSLERVWSEQKGLFESAAEESVVVLAELIRTDLRCRYARGQSPAVADYLERFPELEQSNSRVLSLIYEEFCLAEERGEPLDVEAFCDRYPRWKDSLASQLQYHHLFSQAAATRPKPVPFPEPGDSFEEFELTALLGRGGTARVFLARDLSLGGKQVVLKVSLDRGREPQAQGALDHPHIVPVNSVVFNDDGMRGLSMPYRPGLPLDEVIRRVAPASRPRDALALWRVLVDPNPAESSDQRPASDAPVSVPKGDGWDGFPIRGTYAHGVAWVVKVIADALNYAHRHQTFHRDVKPANVLLTLQFGPQLLDFNLAESPHSAAQAQAAMHGGTLPYMAPEQIEAFLNPDHWGRVGARADIYSLGLVLRELLTGQAPDIPAETLAPARAMRVLLDRRPMLDVSVRRSNPAIPHALEAIVGRCLKVPVEERYADAGALAEDLDRFLHREPLLHAVNPSHSERLANWTIRKRSRLVVLATLATILATGALFYRSTRPPRPLVSIVDSSDLLSAIALLDQDNHQACQEILRRLVALYPDSCLPRAYLGFAHDAEGHQRDSDEAILPMIDRPEALQELVDWGPRDLRLLARLRSFIDHRFQVVSRIEKDRLAENLPGKPLDDQNRLARWAARIALGVNPPSLEFQFDLAKADQELRRYDEVIALASRALLSLDQEAQQHRDSLRRLESLDVKANKWRWLRARAHIMRAEQRRQKAPDLALFDLARADADLDASIKYLTSHSRETNDQVTFHRIRLVASMKRIDVLLSDRSDYPKARAEVARAREVLKRYDDYAQNSHHAQDRTFGIQKRKELDELDIRCRKKKNDPGRSDLRSV